ncbi:MAG: phage tail tape measure protein, partial [Candidatus Alkanophagales archaeon]
MAAVGSNNVYVDIIFRLQAEAAKKAERIIGRLIQKGQLATLTLEKFKFPEGFPKSTVDATNKIFKFAQKAKESERAASNLWRSAISPLTKEFELQAQALMRDASELESYTRMQWDAIRSNKEILDKVRALGATEENYREVLSQKANELRRHAALYSQYAEDLKSGGRLLREELANQRRLWRIYQLTGVRLEGLNEGLIRHARVLDSILPISERTWRPMSKEFKALATGLDAFNKQSARNLMILTRNAAAAEAFGEPMAIIDKSAARLLRTISPLNYQIAKMGISQAITASLSKELAEGQARITRQTLKQAEAIANAAASFDRLALPAQRNLILGSQLYDIYKGNSRMALELESSIRDATGILDYHSRGLHLVNRALRAQNANFKINYNTLKRITEEGWAAFTEEQRKALLAIRDAYQAERRLVGALQPHQRALLQLIEATEEYDRALHFQLRTAGDAEFLLKRLKTVGYEGLTEAEKRAISELERNIALTWTWDSRTKTLAQRIIALKDAYKEQGAILRELTPRQRAFYGGIYRLQTGMNRLSRFIDKVSISSLKLLGPIFLATAAINTFGRIIGTCIESFTNYENALMDLRVSGSLTIETANRLSQDFTSLERILPVSATEMLGIARAAAKAGVTGEYELKRFTLALAKFTQVTGWSADEASEALLKISRAFNIPIEEAERLASMMHYLAIVSVADADDIVNAMTRVGASAVNLGIIAEEAAAMATTLIDAGMSARRAGTRLRAFLREFLKKSDKIVEVMRNAGDAFSDFGDIIRTDPAKALKIFLEYLAGIDDEAERARIVYKIFGSVAGFAVLTLAEHYPLLKERMEAAHREMIYGTRLSKDFSKWMDATSVSLKKASNAFDRLKRSIGAALSPAVVAVAEGLSGIIETLFPSARRGIELMTEGTREWIETFEAGAPAAEKLAERLVRMPRAPAPRRPGVTRYWITQLERERKETAERNRLIEEGTYDYINYVETVVSGADDIFARTGDIIDLLEKQGMDVSDLRDLENDYFQETQRASEARKLASKIEEKYGSERIRRIAEEIRLTGTATDASEEEIAAAKEWLDLQDFLAKADAERAKKKLELIEATRKAAEQAEEEPGITYESYKALNDYVTLVDSYDAYLKEVNGDEALSLALLSRHGPLYRDLKRYIPANELANYSKRLEESARSGKSGAPIIKEINDYLDAQGLQLVETSEGWRITTKSEEEHNKAAERVHAQYKKLIEDTENLDQRMRTAADSAARFFDEFNKGWRIIDNYIDAIFGTAEAKTELDRRLRYTAPGIMFRREYSSQIETLEQLVSEYEDAAKAGDMNTAAQKRQAIMAHMVAFAQQVVNDVMAENNPILRQQKMGWLDLVRYFYQWVYGVTGEMPAATAELDKFAKTALGIPEMAELTTYLNLNTDPATTKLNEWIEQNTGKTIEIQITPIMAREIEEWIKAAPAGGAAPTAQRGGYVLRTGYALIHKGEFILPRELVEEIRRGRKKERVEVSRQLAVHINNLNVG